MVDSNIQREELLPSERAFALKMKLEAMKRQGKRNDLQDDVTSDQDGPKSVVDLTSAQNERKLEAADIVGMGVGLSHAQVRRYIRLTELIPELLDLVDKKRLQFICAVEISYFDKTIQKWLNEYIRENVVIKPSQIAVLKEVLKTEHIDQERMIQVLRRCIERKEPTPRVVMSEKKLRRYFPKGYTNRQMEQVIEALLEQWSKEQGGEADLIVETVVGKGDSMSISGQTYPRELVKAKFLKLNMSHVEYIMDCLLKNTTKVRNIKAYLLATLFNAGSTMSSYYRAEVNHDMPQFAGLNMS